MRLGRDSFQAVYGIVATTRLGLRYVDIIDRKRISDDLGRAVAWEGLVKESFLRVPTGLATPDDTHFVSEVTSPMEEGLQTVRFGLVRDEDGLSRFRLDVDRYIEGMVPDAEILERLHPFTDDIFSLFVAAAGPDLAEWMKGGET